MAESLTTLPSSTPNIIILTGTHVTGKETIALFLSSTFQCPWLKGALIHDSALTISRAQGKRGEDLAAVYGEIWLKKMQRVGLMTEAARSACVAVISSCALRHLHRDAIRNILRAQPTPIRTIFVILQISHETLSGRTLGAENSDLAEKIMREKREDLVEPMEDEGDVLVVDALRDVDALVVEIEEGVIRLVERR